MNKALCFPTRNAFFSPYSLMLPIKGKREGAVRNSQSPERVHLFLCLSFPWAKAWMIGYKGWGSQAVPALPSGKMVKARPILAAPSYCKQQLLAIKARPLPCCFVNNLDDKSTWRWCTDLPFISVRPDAAQSLPFHCKTQIRTWLRLKWLWFNLNKAQLSFVEGGKSSECAEECVMSQHSNSILGF